MWREGRGREGGLCGGREGSRQRAVWRGWGGEVREGCGGEGKGRGRIWGRVCEERRGEVVTDVGVS